MKTEFSRFPWVRLVLHAKPDPLGFFEAIALSGHEGQFVRILASAQNYFFGARPFGKRAIKVEGNKITVIRSVDFGRDWDQQEYFWDQAGRCFRSTHDNRAVGLELPR